MEIFLLYTKRDSSKWYIYGWAMNEEEAEIRNNKRAKEDREEFLHAYPPIKSAARSYQIRKLYL